MSNIDWLNGLDKALSNNISKFLEVLEININSFYKIKISGNSFRATTIQAFMDVLSSRKIKNISILFRSDDILDNIYVGYNNLDDASIDFHIGCLKTISEEINLDISYYEALLLIGLNYARENKIDYVIVDEAYDFINVISYDYIIDLNNRGTYNLDSIDSKDYYEYKCELSSFAYQNIDYDLPLFGAYMGKYVALALLAIKDIFPKLKNRKIKKAIEGMNNRGMHERVNLNPRVVLNHMDSSDLDLLKDLIAKATKKKVYVISNSSDYKPDYLCEDIDEISKVILNANINDFLLITGSYKFIKEIRPMFFK